MSKPRSNKHKTASGLPLEPLYGPADGQPGGSESPGRYPFTRGIHPGMYRDRFWTMRQYAGFGSAREANERYHYLLKSGTTGLSVAFDLPTQMGRDSDDPLSTGEVGRVGVAISSIEDMEILLKDIPLETVSISMTINATAAILLGFLLVVAERRGVKWDLLQGTIQNDLLKEYIARGTYIYPPRPALRIVTDIIAFCGRQVPKWNTISISGYHIREAGSTAVQELAYTLADGIAYVESALKAGLSVDEFGTRLAFFFNCHNDFLEEIAKFRAARRLWARIMRERFNATNERAMMLRFHTQTAGSSLTAQQPLNNVVRTTIQGMAAVLGGTQSLHTNSYDEAIGLPTQESATLALRTQQIIAYESGIPAVVDPFGGSYVIEDLTDRIEAAAEAEIKKIDEMGGMLIAIEQRYPQNQIERAAYQYQQEIERGERVIVGVNSFIESEADDYPPFAVTGEAEQVQRIREFKAHRDSAQVATACAALERAAATAENLMPVILAAIRAGATLGEISHRLRAVFGEYHER